MRGLGFRPRDTSEVAAATLTKIDVCWSAGVGLSNVDWIRGAEFQARGLLLALRAGEPYRVARALAVEAAQAATAGRPARRRAARLLDRAESLARGSGRPYALGMVALARGVSAYLEGRWRDALGACDGAEAIFRDGCTGVAWELNTAHAYALWALSHLGEWVEMSRRFPVLINEARERGDLYAEMNLSTYILTVVRLAADEPGAARDELRRVAGQWSREGYHVQHNDQVWAEVLTDLYAGDGPAAWDRITRHWPTLSRSLLMRVQFIRVAMWGLRPLRPGRRGGGRAAPPRGRAGRRAAGAGAAALGGRPGLDDPGRLVRAAGPPGRGGGASRGGRKEVPGVRHGPLRRGSRPPPRRASRRPRRGRPRGAGRRLDGRPGRPQDRPRRRPVRPGLPPLRTAPPPPPSHPPPADAPTASAACRLFPVGGVAPPPPPPPPPGRGLRARHFVDTVGDRHDRRTVAFSSTRRIS